MNAARADGVGDPGATAPSYTAALAAALATVADGGPRRGAPQPLRLALHATLLEPVCADRDQPPFDRAQMDGYALRHADLGVGVPIPLHRTIAAGDAADFDLPPGTCAAIATGAPLPRGADTVVQHELSDRDDPVRFAATVPPGHAIHRRAADARAGDVVVRAGTRLAARHLALAAAMGVTEPNVVAAPRVALLTSGDEVVGPDTAPAPHQVRNSNATMLVALLPSMGAQLGTVTHLADESAATNDALRAALECHDLVISVGGISAGMRDRFVEAIAALRLRTVVRRVALRPGGPLTVAVDDSCARRPILLGLPGNPVSALVCAHLFAWPMLRALSGVDSALPWHRAPLADPTPSRADRQAFRPASRNGSGTVRVPTWAGSGDLTHTAMTDGIVELPRVDGTVPAGTEVRFLPWADQSP